MLPNVASRRAWTDTIAPLGRIAFDTNSFIYLFEGTEPKAELVEEALWRVNRGLAVAVMSTLVELELLVRPLREGDTRFIDRLHLFLRSIRNLQVRPVDRIVARTAARIRATTGMKAPDAIVAATASVEQCDAIIGNDRGFAKRSEVRYILLDEYAG